MKRKGIVRKHFETTEGPNVEEALPPPPMFFVSVAYKGLRCSASSLFATHRRRPRSVASKGLRLHQNCAEKCPFPLAGMSSRICSIFAQTVRGSAEERTRSRAASEETDVSRRGVLSNNVGTFPTRSEQVGRLAMRAQDAHP